MYFCASSRLCKSEPDSFARKSQRAQPLHRRQRPQTIWRKLMKIKSPIYPLRKSSLPYFLLSFALLALTALTVGAQTQTDNTAIVQDPGDSAALAVATPTP